MNMATAEIQNMKSFMQTMVEAVRVMQSMMMSNASDDLAATGPIVGERPKKWSQRGSLTELGDSEGSGHNSSSHRPKRLYKRKLANLITS